MTSKGKGAADAPKIALNDRDVMAPESLVLSASMDNGTTLREWLPRLVLYVGAMQALDRAVLVRLDDGELSFSSVEEEL